MGGARAHSGRFHHMVLRSLLPCWLLVGASIRGYLWFTSNLTVANFDCNKPSEKPWEDRLMAVGKNWSCPIVMERGGLEIAAYFCELRDNARKLAWGISPKLLQMPTPWAFSAAAPLAASRICVKELHSGQSHLTHYAKVSVVYQNFLNFNKHCWKWRYLVVRVVPQSEATMQDWQQGL